MANLNLPVLIYISRVECPACEGFQDQFGRNVPGFDVEWDKAKYALRGKARFVKIKCAPKEGLNAPPPLMKYAGWFPSVVMAGPRSYFRCFTPEDQVNTEEYSNTYQILGKKFNSVMTPGGYEHSGRPNTAENLVNWFNINSENIPDEPTPPRRFTQYF